MTRLRRGDPWLLVVAAPVLVLVALGWKQRWATDDAYINFRIVDNLLEGYGPVFNEGERVESYTSTLWLGLLALVHGVTGLNLPWIAVLLGLGLATLGLAAASAGSVLLWRREGETAPLLPLGAAVFVALPPVWDFATSGLETGLSFAWLGLVFLALVRLVVAGDGAPRPRSVPVAVLVGLGPLVRPDLAIFSAGFLLVLLVTERRWRLLLWAAALPLAYQVFRMGYFAALVPNTAFAKEAGDSLWGRGWDYLRDFADPYVLFVPLLALAALGAIELRRHRAEWRSPRFLVAAAPVACGALHALYVIRVGGDFMHGRLFLPSLFGLLLPAMTVLLVPFRVVAPVAAVTLAWALLCGVALRVDYGDDPFAGARFEDERAFYVAFANQEDPITLEDYARASWVVDVRELQRATPPHVRLHPPSQAYRGDDPDYPDLRARAGLPNDLVGAYYAVGLVAYAAGPDVTIVDRLGLGDAFASRLRFRPLIGPDGRARDPRYRAGHEKNLPLPWVVARYADTRDPVVARDPAVAAASRAMGCGRLRDLAEATSEPLTAGRFLSNLRNAFRLHGFRFSGDPETAARAECGGTT